MVVVVVAAVAVVADFVCAAGVPVCFSEGWVSVLACVAVGVLLVLLAVVPSARLEAVRLRLLATLAPPPEPHAAKVNSKRPSTPT